MTGRQMMLSEIPREILVTDPNTRDEDDDRLAGQNLVIYGMLMERARSNKELSGIALDYRGRIRDIRNFLKTKGQTVKCIFGKGGLNFYAIIKNCSANL